MKDTRELLIGIRTPVTDTNRAARVLGKNKETLDADLDEVAGMYSQKELDKLVENETLAGEWKSTKKEAEKETEETVKKGK